MTLMGMVAAVIGHTETTVKRSPEGVFICAAEDMLQINKDISVARENSWKHH